MTVRTAWIPTTILVVGCLLNGSTRMQRTMDLAAPLSTFPNRIDGFEGSDITMTDEEVRVAGVSDYLFRLYRAPEQPEFSIYVGYYASQARGKTIHSPKNCLPGAGWEALASQAMEVSRPGDDPVRVNRFMVANKDQKAVVYYWYQGRGRTESNEYRVKLDLMFDAAITRRTEEALVRIVLPLDEKLQERDADAMATDLIRRVSVELKQNLPA
ncbi:MAG: exosortase C-terminal domain/associated protein EpsI [Gemmatimonadales bacterium]